MEPDKPKLNRLSFLSPRNTRSGSFTSGFSGPLSPHGPLSPNSRAASSSSSNQRSDERRTALAIRETVLKKHLPVLMAAQAHLPDAAVPLFLISVSRFVCNHVRDLGMLDDLKDANEKTMFQTILDEAAPGSEYQFKSECPARVVLKALSKFLSSIPTPSVITFEVRALLRSLLKSPANATVAQLAAFLSALPGLNRQVLLEVAHIIGMVCENTHANLCRPVSVCARFAEILLAEEYSSVLDDGSQDEASPEAQLLLRLCTYRRDLLFAMNAAPFMGHSSYDLLWCISSFGEFVPGKERVTDICYSIDGSVCTVGSLGSMHVRSPHCDMRFAMNVKQPLMFVTAVGSFAYWVRGEMFACIFNSMTGERMVKLSKNVRCFLHLPRLGKVWGGSEGAIYVFDASTGADGTGSIPFLPPPSQQQTAATPVSASPPGKPFLKRQESEMVDEETLSNVVSGLAAPLAPKSQRLSVGLGSVSSSSTPGGSSVLTRSSSAGLVRVPVRFLAESQSFVWAAGANLVRIYPQVDPPPPAPLATVEEESDITGITVLDYMKDVAVAVTVSGLLVRYTVQEGFKVKREQLKAAPSLKLLGLMGETCLLAANGCNLLVFHGVFLRLVGTVATHSPITCFDTQQCAGVSDRARWEVCVGHEDGSVRRWTISLDGFEASSTSARQRSATVTEALAAEPFIDAQSGASVNSEEVVIDRAKIIESDSSCIVYSGKWRRQNVNVRETTLELLSAAEIADLVSSLEEFPKIRHHLWCQLFCHSLSSNRKLTMVTAPSKTSLDALLKEGKMRWRLRMKIAEQVAQFLAFLHGLTPAKLHLDLTTYSVLLDDEYNVMIDGLYGPNRVRNKHTSQMTSNVLLKSQRVLPPEMLIGKRGGGAVELTPASDMYQFGMLLWSLMLQESPFHEIVSLKELRETVCVVGQRPAIPETCPQSIREVLFACWDQDPAARPTAASLLSKDVFARGYLEHALDDPVAFDFWANQVCVDKAPGKLLEPVSLGDFCSKLAAATGSDTKTISMAEEMFKNFLVYNNMVHVGDFGEMLLRFGKMRLCGEWLDLLISQLVTPGMYGAISSETAEETLMKCKRGDYLFRFTRSQKGGLMLHVRGSEGVRGYLIVPSGGSQVGWKLKESSQNRFFPSLDDLVKQYAQQLNLKTPLDHGIFSQCYRKVMGTEKKRSLFAKKSETLLVPSSNYKSSLDDNFDE